MSVQVYRQYEGAWADTDYDGGQMRNSGCGPAACAIVLGISPEGPRDWLQANGYATGGTEPEGLGACIKHFGYDAEFISGADEGKDKFKEHMKSGKTAILHMKPGNPYVTWTNNGHYISVVSYDASQDTYKVIDPGWDQRDGDHPWNHFYPGVVDYTLCSCPGMGSSSSSGPVKYEYDKYELTNLELDTIARLCQSIISTASGVKKIASVIANRFEYQKSKPGGYQTPSEYVQKTYQITHLRNKASNASKSAVKDVLVKGNRAFPTFVTRVNKPSDISKAYQDNKEVDTSKPASFVQDKTQIHPKTEKTYIFWEYGDGMIFGYDDKDLRAAWDNIVNQESTAYTYTGVNLDVDFSKLCAKIIQVYYDSSDTLDFVDLRANHNVAGVMINAGYYFDINHRVLPRFRNQKLYDQIPRVEKSGLPYGYMMTGRARTEQEADKEMYELSFIVRKYPPKLGVWIKLDLTNSVTTNDMILERYYTELVRLGLKGKVGIQCTRDYLDKITWDDFKDTWYLWLIEHVSTLEELDKLLDPEFFDIDGLSGPVKKYTIYAVPGASDTTTTEYTTKYGCDIDFVLQAIQMAEDDRYYYAHSSDSFSYSCSTFVARVLYDCKYFPRDIVPANGSAIGGDNGPLHKALVSAGFKKLLASSTTLQPGDILVFGPSYHVAICIDANHMVGANGNGTPVDKSPTAIAVTDMFATPQYIFRLPADKLHHVSSSTTQTTATGRVKLYLEYALQMAADDNYVYVWGGSHGGELNNGVDCSAFVYWSMVKSGAFQPFGCFTTSGMGSVLQGLGFVEIPWPGWEGCKAGDILVTPGSHTEIYVGPDNICVGAHTDKVAIPDQVSQRPYGGTFSYVYRLNEA